MTYSYEPGFDEAIVDEQSGGEYNAAEQMEADLQAENEAVAAELGWDTSYVDDSE